MLFTSRNSTLISSVKFIARMQWVAYGNFNGFISVRTYVDKLTEIKSFRAENDKVTALAVHPSHPHLLSCSKDNMIKAWDWDQGWMCAKKFSCHGEGICSEGVLKFNPNDDNTFASVSTHGYSNKCEIKVLSFSPLLLLLLITHFCTRGPHFRMIIIFRYGAWILTIRT